MNTTKIGNYDLALAEHILNTVTGEMDANFWCTSPMCKPSTAVLEMLRKQEKFVLLDVRTTEECGVIALSHPQALSIPLHELFKKENLDRLPQDSKIVVICHSTGRSAGAAMLLKAIGFKDVNFLNYGLVSLITDLTPNTIAADITPCCSGSSCCS